MLSEHRIASLSTKLPSSTLDLHADKMTHISHRLMLTALKLARFNGDPCHNQYHDNHHLDNSHLYNSNHDNVTMTMPYSAAATFISVHSATCVRHSQREWQKLSLEQLSARAWIIVALYYTACHRPTLTNCKECRIHWRESSPAPHVSTTARRYWRGCTGYPSNQESVLSWPHSPSKLVNLANPGTYRRSYSHISRHANSVHHRKICWSWPLQKLGSGLERSAILHQPRGTIYLMKSNIVTICRLSGKTSRLTSLKLPTITELVPPRLRLVSLHTAR